MSRGKERIVVSMFTRYARRKTKPAGCVLQGEADRTQTEQKPIRQYSYFQVKNRDCSNHIDENILKFYNKLLFRYTRIPEFV